MPEFETVKVIADIIAHEMSIPVEQIALYDRSVPAPGQISGLHIAIDVLEKKVLNNNTRHKSSEGDDDLQQVQTLQVQEQICINIISTSPEAHMRNHEIVFALGSTYAQQVQEKHGLIIERIPSAYIKVFDAVLSTGVNRYTITVNAQRVHLKEGMVDTFTKFRSVKIITDPSNHNSTP